MRSPHFAAESGLPRRAQSQVARLARAWYVRAGPEQRAQAMAYRPGAARGAAAYNQYMEGDNDALVNGLASKVSQLKELSIQIGADVRESNNMLGDLDNNFDSAGNLLGSTMKRLGLLSKGGGNCTMTYLAAFVFFIFILLWRLTK